MFDLSNEVVADQNQEVTKKKDPETEKPGRDRFAQVEKVPDILNEPKLVEILVDASADAL